MLAVVDNTEYNTALIVGHIPGQTSLIPSWKIHTLLPQLNSQGLQQVEHITAVWLENRLCYQHPRAYSKAGINPHYP